MGRDLTPRPLLPDDSSSESGSGNGSSTLNPSTSSSTQGDPAFPEMNGNGAVAPMDFTATAEDQPINLCDKLPAGTALSTPSYPSDSCGADGLRSRVKYGVKTTPEVCGAARGHMEAHTARVVREKGQAFEAPGAWAWAAPQYTSGSRLQPPGVREENREAEQLLAEPQRLAGGGTATERTANTLTRAPGVRCCGRPFLSCPGSSGSYDSIKTEVSGCPEDLTVGRAPPADDDDDDHDDHEDNDKMNDSEGMDPERLKAFNMFVRLFVDENLDRMVPISKQPKEKIQAIIESCSRQFPEFQERARKRIRTYLKSCRRMKKNGMEMVSPALPSALPLAFSRTLGLLGDALDPSPTLLLVPLETGTTRPTPPHLTSAMAENILAAACESETRKAAKRMRLEIYQPSQDEPIALDKQHSRDSAAITHSTYSLPASSYSQDPVYVNGGLNYSYRGYGALGSNLQPPASLQTGNHSNGPTDLSMKGGASTTSTTPTPTPSSNSTSRTMPTAQLSPTEISAVRQLIAGYRESAAFLLRSADELENLILQQN
ncbi:Nucleolar protein 4-like [Galemys pyrenaicus]|uniref:Nucleolar protein 4-like n=1 Tax=Galemys pyrenaicus TaxID=202257 RepID=A0A8J6AVQ0_GALPY|nr:Nucleolar protein 4-like [Galemys pyrenaicus]